MLVLVAEVSSPKSHSKASAFLERFVNATSSGASPTEVLALRPASDWGTGVGAAVAFGVEATVGMTVEVGRGAIAVAAGGTVIVVRAGEAVGVDSAVQATTNNQKSVKASR